ncbi:MAG: 3'-5'-bisphosphate nucleotidase [Candidatus Entotheonella factor]|uniref:3'(2'),5'-bisphosphate nucleotidase CysQ n=1 Tax=Entotheonella factor TaxID=1429438 RepID=W4LLH6_ENTF1|nr:3'(2'),5'-bisphosphate nucleotidase CysQ [Candidatus Entotheonella palauensis]ETW98807.1 MAG: 3'-5'-bisphosphate nucleotidase [Candidatus Entotheonella factor]
MSYNPKDLIEPVKQIARQAGQRILDIYESDYAIEQKEDASPLTEADLAAHKTIVEGLSLLTPEWPILSEESSDIPFSERATWSQYWLVDPLDGTREFISRNGEFTVNIALIQDHEAVLGVVHVPVQDTDYYGEQSLGAFVERSGSGPQAIGVSPFTSAPARVVGSRSHRGNSLDNYLARLGEHELVSMGSSLKICLVAEGRADVYPRLGPTSEWDTAAAHAVVTSAGGHVVDVDGNPLRYNTKDEYLNPFFIVYGDRDHDWLSYL